MSLIIKREDTQKVLICNYTPERVDKDRSIELIQTSPPGSAYPRMYFSRGGIQKSEFTLWFDGTRTSIGGVPTTSAIYAVSFLDDLLGKKDSTLFFNSAPFCIVSCGKMVYRGILESYKETVEIYDKNYEPFIAHYDLKWVVYG